MRKRNWKAAAVFMGICMMTGCSSEDDKEQYHQPPGLDPLQVTFIALEVPPEEAGPAGPETDSEPKRGSAMIVAEATGAEEESVETVRRAVDVYNHPSEDSSRLGNLKRGIRVSAIGPTGNGDWYMIEYNGRVAYVEADAIAAPERASQGAGQSSVPTPTRSPEPTVTPTVSVLPEPSSSPTATPKPSPSPSEEPSSPPPVTPTVSVSPEPSTSPTVTPDPEQPSEDPSPTPDPEQPSEDPSPTPDPERPSEDPSPTPGTERPSEDPSPTPGTEQPSEDPSPTPGAEQPSEAPSPTPGTE